MSQQFELPERNPQSEYALEAYREKLAVFECGEIEIGMWILKDKYLSTSPWENKFVIKLPKIDLASPIGFLHNGLFIVLLD